MQHGTAGPVVALSDRAGEDRLDAGTSQSRQEPQADWIMLGDKGNRKRPCKGPPARFHPQSEDTDQSQPASDSRSSEGSGPGQSWTGTWKAPSLTPGPTGSQLADRGPLSIASPLK